MSNQLPWVVDKMLSNLFLLVVQSTKIIHRLRLMVSYFHLRLSF